MSQAGRIDSRSQWVRLVGGLALVFGLFHWSASALGSFRGESGLVVAALVVAATLAVERVVFGRPVSLAVVSLGLGRPRLQSLIAAGSVALLLFLVVLVFGAATETSLELSPGWGWLVGGLFAQAGVAEEVLFRGYLFGRLRAGRSFRCAAVASMLPFVAVHLLLFLSMPWPLALASLVLSVVVSFPLAYLFDLGGATIWAPAFLHFVIQGTAKVVVTNGATAFPLVWMGACALVPLLVFVVKPAGALRVERVTPVA